MYNKRLINSVISRIEVPGTIKVIEDVNDKDVNNVDTLVVPDMELVQKYNWCNCIVASNEDILSSFKVGTYLTKLGYKYSKYIAGRFYCFLVQKEN